ncbi:MAG: O-methyltransferase [Candidatus Omnitrophota bacterium]
MLSFEKFNYWYRPAKQIERRLIIDALLRLSECGDYPISAYTYFGFGSIYYVDFVMFHKYLSIKKMICCESENIPKRMKFNKPYRFISLKMNKASDVIPYLAFSSKYFVWLDYEKTLDKEVLEDVSQLCRSLRPGSILLITMDADEDRSPEEIEDELLSQSERRKQKLEYYQANFQRFTKTPIINQSLDEPRLPKFFSEVVYSRIEEVLAGRGGVNFFPLFNFLYADNAQMLTLGGIIDGDEGAARLQTSGIYGHDFIRRRYQSLKITAPPLTLRERYWLDKKIGHQLRNNRLPFELRRRGSLKSYAKFYKHYPIFSEILV